MPVEVRKLADAMGAEIRGVDLARALTDTDFATIRRALVDHGVIVLRGQDLPPERHIAFTTRFGAPDIHPLTQFHLPGHPEVLVLSNKKRADGAPVGLEDAGRYWHTDVSFQAEPALGSLLYAVEIPPAGGDTLFASQYAAWDALPAAMKGRLRGKRAFHGLNRSTAPKFTAEQLARVVPVPHPLARRHPESGRIALYAGMFATAIEGMDENESRDTLAFLYEHAAQEAFQYRHVWQQGDLVMWDNRSVLHHATSFDPQHIRHMHRTTVVGDVPV